MDKELIANETKGNWNEWKPSIPDALSELIHHVNKLEDILNLPWHVVFPKNISEYAADVANIAMKIEEMFGFSSLEKGPTQEQMEELRLADEESGKAVESMKLEQRKELHQKSLQRKKL